MIVLGFDTSTRATAVGLRLADGSALCASDDPPEGAHPGHATRLLSMAEELIARAGVSWEAIERIAFGVGPGRFTGLRVGAATARGLAQSLGVELVGVSTLRALAEPAIAAGERRSHVAAVIDALRGEVFAAAFTADGPHAASESALEGPLRAVELGSAIRTDGEGSAWCAIGDGAVRYRRELESAGMLVPDGASALHRVDGATICELAAHAHPVERLEDLVPDYRRRADAEGVRDPSAAGRGVSALQAASQ